LISPGESCVSPRALMCGSPPQPSVPGQLCAVLVPLTELQLNAQATFQRKL